MSIRLKVVNSDDWSIKNELIIPVATQGIAFSNTIVVDNYVVLYSR